MFVYKIHAEDGDDLGEATYLQLIKPGETIWLSGARQVRVLDLIETRQSEKYAGLLRVETDEKDAHEG